MRYPIPDVDTMLSLGRTMAQAAAPGEIWQLCGDLGAGKTHWTKGFVEGLGCNAEVTSPTFSLLHEYEGGRLPVFHFDFYRLNSVEELYALGWDEILEQRGVILAEWGNRFPGAFPATVHQLQITLEVDGSRFAEVIRGAPLTVSSDPKNRD